MYICVYVYIYIYYNTIVVFHAVPNTWAASRKRLRLLAISVRRGGSWHGRGPGKGSGEGLLTTMRQPPSDAAS